MLMKTLILAFACISLSLIYSATPSLVLIQSPPWHGRTSSSPPLFSNSTPAVAWTYIAPPADNSSPCETSGSADGCVFLQCLFNQYALKIKRVSARFPLYSITHLNPYL